MAPTPLPLLLCLTSLLFPPQTLAQSLSPLAPINITSILAKAGQYTTFIHLLTKTQIANEINYQVSTSKQGMTVFSPTDDAFDNLPAGTLNNLTTQQQAQLVLYHVVPQFYSLTDFQTVSNPVQTQAIGQNGSLCSLYFSSEGSQVNVSTGVVETPVNNALCEAFPLAVYEVDKVLMLSPELWVSDSRRLGTGLSLVAGFMLFCIGLLS